MKKKQWGEEEWKFTTAMEDISSFAQLHRIIYTY